jgi:hypothetical protein
MSVLTNLLYSRAKGTSSLPIKELFQTMPRDLTDLLWATPISLGCLGARHCSRVSPASSFSAAIDSHGRSSSEPPIRDRSL